MALPALGGGAAAADAHHVVAAPQPATLLAEGFAAMVAEHFGETCVVLVLHPWSGAAGPKPAGVLAPREAGSLADLGAEELQAALRGRETLVAPCTFDMVEEEAAAWQLVPKFAGVEDFCTMLVHLLPPNLQPSRTTGDAIMARYSAMLATGVDDVLMDPERDPDSFRCAMGLARSVWQMNVRRMQLMLQAEPELVSEEAIKDIQRNHRSLLWEQIPKALMPQFAQINKQLVETTNRVDQFNLLSRCETVAGCAVKAIHNRTDETVVIKVIEKSQVCTPGELEGIYREFRFLSHLLEHPAISRCILMLHSPMRVYLVFPFAGDMNLTQMLSSQPGDRLDEEDTMDVFSQVVAGMTHCHSRDVAHRRICLEHVVVRSQPGSRKLQVKLVDFHSAMVSRGEMVSRTICGTLPCIAPEMALGAAYVPWRADCWSVGVVLLEMGGGLASMSRAVPFNPQGALGTSANAIVAFLQGPESCRQALAYAGGVSSETLILKLEALLRPDPQERRPMSRMLESEPPPGPEPPPPT